jgi:hypothetical protein
MSSSEERDEVPETKVLAVASHVCARLFQLNVPMSPTHPFRLLISVNRCATGQLSYIMIMAHDIYS